MQQEYPAHRIFFHASNIPNAFFQGEHYEHEVLCIDISVEIKSQVGIFLTAKHRLGFSFDARFLALMTGHYVASKSKPLFMLRWGLHLGITSPATTPRCKCPYATYVSHKSSYLRKDNIESIE